MSLFSIVDRGNLVLMKTSDYGGNVRQIAENIFSFGIGGRFLFASVMTGTVSICIMTIVPYTYEKTALSNRSIITSVFTYE